MPTYDYRCSACGHEFEQFHSITAASLKKCPSCGKSKLVRLIGTGAGVIFRGSGFYETDYRSDSYKKAAEAEQKSAAPATDGGAAKPDAPAKSDAPAKTDTAAKSAEPAAKAPAAAPAEKPRKTPAKKAG